MKFDVNVAKRAETHRGRPVQLEFYPDRCGSCIETARFTFSDARVAMATTTAGNASAGDAC